MENLFVYFFLSFLIIFNALMIIINTNPIHSIFFLILVFVCTTILLILLGVEFIAMLFLVVYIGAITVLFLFVIMMLNVKIIEFNEKFITYLPIGIFLGIIFLLEIFFLISNNLVVWNIGFLENHFFNINETLLNNYCATFNNYFDIISLINVEQLAIVLYTKFVYLFFLGGIILLVAMLGAIVLTLNQEFKNKRQDYYKQSISSIKKSIRYIVF